MREEIRVKAEAIKTYLGDHNVKDVVVVDLGSVPGQIAS